MAFDLSTARPIARKGFDISTAKPLQQFVDPDVPVTDEAGDIVTRPQQPEPERSLGEVLTGIGETAKTFATGATFGTAGMAAGFLKQLSKEVASGEFGSAEAADRIEREASRLAELMTDTPESEAGQEFTREIGKFLQPLEAVAPQAGAAASIPIKPAVAAFRAKLGPSKALINPDTGLPSKDFAKALKARDLDFGAVVDDVDLLPQETTKRGAVETVDNIIKSKLKQGSADKVLHKYKLNAVGGIEKDDLGIQAVGQGLREGDVASMKGANLETKSKMLRMLNVKRAIESDQSKSLKVRPSDTIGNETMKRFDFVKAEAAKLRKDLDRIAGTDIDPKALELGEGSGSLKGLKIDTQKVQNTYLDTLGDLRVKVDMSEGKPRLDFSQSLISEDKSSQNVINRLTRILAKGEDIDASEAHLVKRQIDTMLDFSKKSPAGLTDSGKKAAKMVRAAINDSIRDVSPKYAEINDKLSSAITAMNDFDEALGSAAKLTNETASPAVGQTLRRLLSNAQSRSNLSRALSNLEVEAKDLGGVFDTQLDRLVIFNQTLDDAFGATARTSLKGDVESALTSGLKGAVLKKVADKAGMALGASDKKRFDVMQKLLKRGQF